MEAQQGTAEHIAHGPEPCSIFVSTRTGQMRNELGFIEHYGPPHPRALIMTAKRDRQLRLNLTDMATSSLFEDHETIVFPNLPTSPRGTLRKVRIYNAMREGVRTLAGASTHIDLYLHHANRYYVYFERIFSELGITSYTLNMLEEGLATYRWGQPGHEDVSSEAKLYLPAEAVLRLGRQVKYFAKHIVGAVTCVLRFVERVGELVLACVCKITGKNLFDSMASLLNRLMPEKYRFGIVPRFKTGYFCFPEKMADTRLIHIDELHALPFTADDSEEEPLEHVSTVFASQRYGDPAIYYEIVLSIFEELGLRSVCFKLHPREDYNAVACYFDEALERHRSVHVVHDKRLDARSVENMIADGSCEFLIGLTTSALLYAPLVDENVRTLSIAERFFELYAQLDPSGLGGQGMDMFAFRDDFALFRVIAPEVEQFDPACARDGNAPAAHDASEPATRTQRHDPQEKGNTQ